MSFTLRSCQFNTSSVSKNRVDFMKSRFENISIQLENSRKTRVQFRVNKISNSPRFTEFSASGPVSGSHCLFDSLEGSNVSSASHERDPPASFRFQSSSHSVALIVGMWRLVLNFSVASKLFKFSLWLYLPDLLLLMTFMIYLYTNIYIHTTSLVPFSTVTSDYRDDRIWKTLPDPCGKGKNHGKFLRFERQNY